MGRLLKIREAVEADRVLVSEHAEDRCELRGWTSWQLIASLPDAKLVRERPSSRPNPSVVLRHTLPDGTETLAIWAWLEPSQRAKLVTAFLDES